MTSVIAQYQVVHAPRHSVNSQMESVHEHASRKCNGEWLEVQGYSPKITAAIFGWAIAANGESLPTYQHFLCTEYRLSKIPGSR